MLCHIMFRTEMKKQDEHTDSTVGGTKGSPVEADADHVVKIIRQIIHEVDVQSKKLAKDTGLSTPQIVVLKAIRDLGEVTTRAVSQSVSLSQPTVTTILDRLEDRKLVERYRSTKDRRIVHSKLTKAGGEILEATPPLLQSTFLERFGKLPEHRRQEIMSALTDVARMMGADTFDASPVLTIAPPQAVA